MKFQLIRRSIQDDETEHVCALADMGMSRKLIAKEVYGAKSSGEPVDGSPARVHNILATYGVRVTDYRNAANKHGRAVVAAIRREADVLSVIRSAQQEVAKAIRKTG